MSQKSPKVEAQMTSDRQHSRRIYDNISYERRQELINRVLAGQDIKEVSRQLHIKLSTSKFIFKSFKEKGRIFRKRTQRSDRKELQKEIQQLRLQYMDQLNQIRQQSQVIYIPVYIPVFMQREAEVDNSEALSRHLGS